MLEREVLDPRAVTEEHRASRGAGCLPPDFVSRRRTPHRSRQGGRREPCCSFTPKDVDGRLQGPHLVGGGLSGFQRTATVAPAGRTSRRSSSCFGRRFDAAVDDPGDVPAGAGEALDVPEGDRVVVSATITIGIVRVARRAAFIDSLWTRRDEHVGALPYQRGQPLARDLPRSMAPESR